MRYRLRDLALRGQRVDGAERAGEVEGRERIVVTGFWIWFRHDLGSKDMAQNTVFLLMGVFVRALEANDQYVARD